MVAYQISLPIYQIDEEATKDAVEKYLLLAREYKVTEYIPEDGSAIQTDPERKRHVERAEKAISRLGGRQQKLIRARYMEDDDVMDFDIAEKLGYSDRHYRRIKSVAIYRLAATLGLLKFHE